MYDLLAWFLYRIPWLDRLHKLSIRVVFSVRSRYLHKLLDGDLPRGRGGWILLELRRGNLRFRLWDIVVLKLPGRNVSGFGRFVVGGGVLKLPYRHLRRSGGGIGVSGVFRRLLHVHHGVLQLRRLFAGLVSVDLGELQLHRVRVGHVPWCWRGVVVVELRELHRGEVLRLWGQRVHGLCGWDLRVDGRKFVVLRVWSRNSFRRRVGGMHEVHTRAVPTHRRDELRAMFIGDLLICWGDAVLKLPSWPVPNGDWLDELCKLRRGIVHA